MNGALTNQYFLSEGRIKNHYSEYLFERNSEWDIFILINRKGYWDYKILFNDEEIQQLKDRNKLVISDRMLEKLPLDERKKLLKDKKVILYDDSLTNGSNMFFYFLLCMKAGAKDVKPIVYALNASFPSQRSENLMRREAKRVFPSELMDYHIEKKIAKFESKLSYELTLSNEDTDRMSIWQTCLFQKNVSPLVMDLPIYNHTEKYDGKKIVLAKKQFEHLKNYDSDQWTFVENEMDVQGLAVKASFFQMKTPFTGSEFEHGFHDFVVKCKYMEHQDVVNVVFTPFALVKSMRFKDVFQWFVDLFEGTVYGKKILKYFKENRFEPAVMQKDHGLCKAMYRAFIYRISDYIGREFQKYVKQLLGVEIQSDRKIMWDNFDEDFIATQIDWDKSYQKEKIEEIIFRHKNQPEIMSLNEYIEIHDEQIKATQEKINNYIRLRVVSKKKKTDSSLEERAYTFETIENELNKLFYFSDKMERRKMITSSCLLFLETNSFSNLILVKNDNFTIYRAFRYGENSEIFLHEQLWFVFSFLYAYYDNYGKSALKKNYTGFMQRVENYLQEKKYFGKWISETGFVFLKKYFGEMSEEELSEEIRRRRYLVESDIAEGEMNTIRKERIKEIADIVNQWGRGEIEHGGVSQLFGGTFA